jgi:pimeloyl-ACP methyl ester carboxylesterase
MYSRANARKLVEVPHSSHPAMLSHPEVVAALIVDAAEAVG